MKIFRGYHLEPLSKLSELLGSLYVVAVGEIDNGTDEEISRELEHVKMAIKNEYGQDEFIVIVLGQ